MCCGRAKPSFYECIEKRRMEKSCSSTQEVRDSIVHGQATSGPYYSAIR